MEVIVQMTALVIAAGTVFAAIYQARSKTEKTLQEHINKLDADIAALRQMGRENDAKWAAQCEDFKKLLETERRRSTRLEKQVRALENPPKRKTTARTRKGE